LRLVLALIDRRWGGGLLLLLGVLVVAVVSNRRSSNERPASCPSPESHGEPFPYVRPIHKISDQSATVPQVVGSVVIQNG